MQNITIHQLFIKSDTATINVEIITMYPLMYRKKQTNLQINFKSYMILTNGNQNLDFRVADAVQPH